MSSSDRRRNMRLLVEWHGLDNVCEALGTSRKHMRARIGRNPHRDISDATACQAERAYDLEQGWMDQPHPELDSIIEREVNVPLDEFIARMDARGEDLVSKLQALDSITPAEKARALYLVEKLRARLPKRH